jgi:hypothetical protein
LFCHVRLPSVENPLESFGGQLCDGFQRICRPSERPAAYRAGQQKLADMDEIATSPANLQFSRPKCIYRFQVAGVGGPAQTQSPEKPHRTPDNDPAKNSGSKKNRKREGVRREFWRPPSIRDAK